MGKVVYLTGSPAAGKTSISERLAELVPNTIHFRFGRELTELLQRQFAVTEEDLRTSTSHVSSIDHVQQINERAIEMCANNRSTKNIIIDTHAVTTETYGFRVTPLSADQICRLQPDMIVCVIASPETTLSRIRESSRGRPELSVEQLHIQAQLQRTLVINYSILTGRPSYFLDNESQSQMKEILGELTAQLESG